MLDKSKIEMLQRHWEDGWNAGDLDTIMAPMSADVVFSSPFVARITGDPAKTTIAGRDALRTYVAASLQRVPGVTYELGETYAGPDSVIIAYRFWMPDGSEKTGADYMQIRDGEITVWISHYPFAADDLAAFIAD